MHCILSTRSRAALLITSLLACGPISALAQSDSPPPTPTQLAGGKVASAEEIKQLVDKKSALLIDTRSPVNFGKGHVPGAISVAYGEKSDKAADFDAALDKFDMSKLPADKNANVVFYSDGPTGWKSYKGAVLAIKAGHKNVLYMRGGWADWTAKGLPEAK